MQMGGCVADDAADRIQPVRAGGQGRWRLETQVALVEMRIALGDVGRVAGDQVEAFAGQRREPVAVAEFDVADAVAQRIAARDCERGFAGIGGDDGRTRPFPGDGERDRAAAGAEVGDARCRVDRNPRQGQLDQQLGLRTRDQGGRADFQFQGPEPLGAGQVGDRLTGAAARDQVEEARHHRRIDRVPRMREQPAARTPEGMRQQPFGIDSIDLPAGLRQQAGSGVVSCHPRMVFAARRRPGFARIAPA